MPDSKLVTTYHSEQFFDFPITTKIEALRAVDEISESLGGVVIGVSEGTNSIDRTILTKRYSNSSEVEVVTHDGSYSNDKLETPLSRDFARLFDRLLEGRGGVFHYTDWDRLVLSFAYNHLNRACSEERVQKGHYYLVLLREMREQIEEGSTISFLERTPEQIVDYPDPQIQTESLINYIYNKAGIKSKDVTSGIFTLSRGLLEKYASMRDSYSFPYSTNHMDLLAITAIVNNLKTSSNSEPFGNIGDYEDPFSKSFRNPLSIKSLLGIPHTKDEGPKPEFNEDFLKSQWIQRVRIARDWIGNLRFALENIVENPNAELLSEARMLEEYLKNVLEFLSGEELESEDISDTYRDGLNHLDELH